MKTIAKIIHDKIFFSSGFFLFFIFVFSFLALRREPAHSQASSLKAAWTKTLGGDYEDLAGSVFQTGDGGFVVGGITTGYGAGEGCDVTLCAYLTLYKLDAKGNKIWSKKFDVTVHHNHLPDSYIHPVEDNALVSVRPAPGSGIIITATVDRIQDKIMTDIYVLKLDAKGNKEWDKVLGAPEWGEVAAAAIPASDGGYIVLGNVPEKEDVTKFGLDVYVAKLDDSGEKVWEKTYGGKNDDKATAIQKAKDGGYIIVGETKSFDDYSSQFYVLKISAGGDKEWEKTYGGECADIATSVTQTKDEGYVVAGFVPLDVKANVCGKNMIPRYTMQLVKIGAEGNILWEKKYHGGVAEDARAYGVLETKDGGLVVAGSYSPSVDVPADAYVMKIDADGNKIAGKTYGGKEGDELYGIAKTSDGGFIAAGESYSFSENCLDFNCGDFYVIKIAP